MNHKFSIQNSHSRFQIPDSKFILLLFCILHFAFCIGVNEVNGAGASLHLSPASGTYTVGSTFLVKVKVNSGGETINAVEGTLVFNPYELNVISLSKTDSIFNLWTTEPTLSNSEGNIVFGGGTPSAFTGSSGTILTIKFQAKASASAQVNFSSGSVLLADGKGTNILSTMTGGVYNLTSEIITPPAEEVPPEAEYIPPAMPTGAPATPVVNSTTHPNPEKWYSNNSPEFSWKLPSGVTAVRLLIGHLPTASPTVLYTPPISEKKLEDLADGVWYFHVQFKNSYGWGGILHRKVLIDTKPPEPFEIEVDNEGDPTNPKPILHFQTTDSVSGVEYYEIKIGQGEGQKISMGEIKRNPYRMPAQAPGEHTIIVKAEDAAGNFSVATAEVIVEPLETPVITEIPLRVEAGDTLTIKGTSSYPNARITVFVKKEGEESRQMDVSTDEQGNWSFSYDKSLEKGAYQVWVKVTDSRGAQSYLTEKITIAAVLPPFLKFGQIAIDYLTVMITLIALIIVLILVILYGWYRITIWRKKIKKETKEAQKALEKAFDVLREEVRDQIAKIDGRPGLSSREKKISDKLKNALKKSEEAISKEIKDIRRELK